MRHPIKWIYLILLFILHFSCVEKKSIINKADKPEAAGIVIQDTLTFTSATRVIFQDSKGNYWFGSNSEGVGFL